MGEGRLALVNPHTGARVDVRYRRADGTYDDVALAAIRRAFRSEGDDGPGKASLRLVETLGWLSGAAAVRPLTLMSGYRSPAYNESLRASGARAAGGSLHTEGLAADVALPRKDLKRLWLRIRAMECCGAGYYAKEGFLHVDVGRPRFWEPQTSRVEENLSAGNARLFARTEFDRYARDEQIVVALHSLTVPPVRIATDATWVPERGERRTVALHAEKPPRDGCVDVTESGGTVTADGIASPGRGRLVLATCAPRTERTPEHVESNDVEVR
jgi:uncharacterized protein YcbK (DUF882 family)